MEADGFSLDDKRNEVKENDIPDIIARFNNLEAEEKRTPYDKSFFVTFDDIKKNNFVLSLNKYQKKHVVKKEYRPTSEIMNSLVDSEVNYIKLLKDTSNEAYSDLIKKVLETLEKEELDNILKEMGR